MQVKYFSKWINTVPIILCLFTSQAWAIIEVYFPNPPLYSQKIMVTWWHNGKSGSLDFPLFDEDDSRPLTEKSPPILKEAYLGRSEEIQNDKSIIKNFLLLIYQGGEMREWFFSRPRNSTEVVATKSKRQFTKYEVFPTHEIPERYTRRPIYQKGPAAFTKEKLQRLRPKLSSVDMDKSPSSAQASASGNFSPPTKEEIIFLETAKTTEQATMFLVAQKFVPSEEMLIKIQEERRLAPFEKYLSHQEEVELTKLNWERLITGWPKLSWTEDNANRLLDIFYDSGNGPLPQKWI